MTWKCPKCGRVFSKQDQHHFWEKPRMIDELTIGKEREHRL